MAQQTEMEVEFMSNPEKIWGAIKNFTCLFPMIFPKLYKSIEVVERDGFNAGSVLLVTYAEGIPIKSVKEKIEVLDEENKLVSYSVVGEDVDNVLINFKKTFMISPKGQGSLAKFIIEYEYKKEGDGIWEPNLIKETAMKIYKELDAYLLKN